MSRFGVVASGFSAPYGTLRPSGQADTVAGLAARLREPWMPDSADRFNLIVDCLMHADTAYTRPECADAMAFTERHARVYTDPNGNQALIGEPLAAGDPWLPFGVWLQRYWYRETPAYHAIPNLETVTWSIPANADGSPPANTAPLAHPPGALSPSTPTPGATPASTPAPQITILQDTAANCATKYAQFVPTQPAGSAQATMLAAFRDARPECRDWAIAQIAALSAPAAGQGWSMKKKVAAGVTLLALAGVGYYLATSGKRT